MTVRLPESRGRVRSGLFALALLVLVALLLRFGVPVAASLLAGFDPIAQESLFTLAVFVPMLLLALAGAAIAGTHEAWLGDRPMRSAGKGGAIGLIGLLLAIAYCRIAGTLTGPAVPVTAAAPIALGLLIVAVQVIAEEALFRGVVQSLLVAALGRAGGIGVTAGAFAGLHLLSGASGAIVAANLMLGGLLFSCLALRSGGIAAPVAAHYLWNAGEQLMFGLDPNPGNGAFGSFVDLDLIGAPVWGGSEQGLNASLAASFALASVLAYLLVRMLRSPAPVVEPAAV